MRQMGNKKIILTVAGFICLLFANFAFAGTGSAGSTDISSISDVFKAAAMDTSHNLIHGALKVATVAAGLSYILSNWSNVFGGLEMSVTIKKLVVTITTLLFTITIINEVDVLQKLYNGYVALSGSIAGTGSTFDAGDVWTRGCALAANIDKAFYKNAHIDGWTDVIKNLDLFLNLLVIHIVMLIAYAVIALAVFMATLEFYMVFAVAPLALCMFPMSQFRDQALAPLKSVMSLGMRLVILGLIVKTSYTYGDAVTSALKGDIPLATFFNQMWMMLGGALAIAAAAFSAGKIASAIASGSSSFSGNEALTAATSMATSAATFATAGATMAMAAKSMTGGSVGLAQKGIGAVGGMMGGGGQAKMSPAAPLGAGAPKMGGPMPSRSDSGSSSSAGESSSSAESGQSAVEEAFSAPASGSGSTDSGSSGQGNGSTAGISGASGANEPTLSDIGNKMDKLEQAMNQKQSKARKLGASGLKAFNKIHNAVDSGNAPVSVSINPHHNSGD